MRLHELLFAFKVASLALLWQTMISYELHWQYVYGEGAEAESLGASVTLRERTSNLSYRQGRWGIFFSYEKICTKACVQNGKFGGRMYGGVCRCYCVRNEIAPCKGFYPSCNRLCQLNFYPLGGECVDNVNCYCTCSVRQPQTPNTTLPTNTTTPCPVSSGSGTNAPGSAGSQGTGQTPGAGAPSPGLLGTQGQDSGTPVL